MSQPSLPSIDLNLFEKLQDRTYRARFFLSEASARIAKQLIGLRKRRGLTQAELAELAGTGQPAISRAERADYRNWSFNTLRSLAEALDARIHVSIEASEDVLVEYKNGSNASAPQPYQHSLQAFINRYRATIPDIGQRQTTTSAATNGVDHQDARKCMSEFVVGYGQETLRQKSSAFLQTEQVGGLWN
jgi:transcriptional regulator with XRE-family HTH domain